LNLIVFFEKTTLVKILPWLLADIVFRWWTALLTDWPAWWGMTLSLGWLAAHPKAVFQKRLSLQKKRTVRDREILPCISGRIAGDGGAFKRILNFISLFYCRVAGLPVLEWGRDGDRRK